MSWRQLFAIHWHWLLLGLIILIALTLRVWGIEFGLPYIYHFDEHFYVNTALKLGTGVINNPPYLPTGFSNLLFGEYASYFVVGKLFGLFGSAQEFEASLRGDPTIVYLLARLTSAVLGTATCLMLYMLGKYADKPVVGLLAAGFLAMSFLHVRDSHYAVPDIAVTFFVTLAIALTTIGMRFNKRRVIYLAAMAGGFAVAIKWTALPVALVVGWAGLWIGYEDETSIVGRLLSRAMLFSILFFLLGFVLGSPQILLDPTPYIDLAFMQSKAGKIGGYEIWQVDTLPGWLFYGKVVLVGMGPILLVLGITGILRRLVLAAKTRDKVSVMLLLFPLTYYLLMGSTRHYFVRYALPLVPFVALFAAEVVVLAVTWVATSRNRNLGWALAIVLIVGAMVQPLVQSIRHDVLLSRQDTRTLAKYWIEAQIPAQANIALDWETYGPPLDGPDTVIPYSLREYNVAVMDGTGLSEHPVAWYREHGFDYLVSSSFIYEIPLVFEEEDAERQKFYASLDQNLRLVQEFRASTEETEPAFIFDEIYGPIVSLWQRERPGPTIKIYQLEQQAPK